MRGGSLRVSISIPAAPIPPHGGEYFIHCRKQESDAYPAHGTAEQLTTYDGIQPDNPRMRDQQVFERMPTHTDNPHAGNTTAVTLLYQSRPDNPRTRGQRRFYEGLLFSP